jgi:xanthine dehydrogenase YagR molybdenum-binding subunit
MVTASIIPAVMDAARAAMAAAVVLAARDRAVHFPGQTATDLVFERGRILERAAASGAGVDFALVLQHAGVPSVTGAGSSKSTYATRILNFRTFLRRAIRRSRLAARACTAAREPDGQRLDGGRIINERTARNQIEGALIMRIGMALFEQTHFYEERSGARSTAALQVTY